MKLPQSLNLPIRIFLDVVIPGQRYFDLLQDPRWRVEELGPLFHLKSSRRNVYVQLICYRIHIMQENAQSIIISERLSLAIFF